MTKRILDAILAMIVMLSVFGCSNDSDGIITDKTLKEFTPISFSRSETETIARTQNFAWSLLRAVDEQEPGSFMISPLSTVFNLAMLANGAQGETLNQIVNALDIDTEDITELNTYANKLIDGIVSVDNSTDIKIANALFVNPKYTVYDDFKNNLVNWYNAEVLQTVSNEGGQVNKWITKHTKNKITNLINPVEETSMYFAVVNALYFDAIWQSPFSASETIEGVFHSPHKESNVHYMCKKKSLSIGQNEKFALTNLKFGNGAFSIYFILPHEGVQLDEILLTIDDAMISSLDYELLSVNLRVPKFKMDSYIDLVEPLKKCGITDAFDAVAADFGNLASYEPSIDFFRQGCSFGIDETGVQAVAVTTSGMLTTAPGPIMDGGDFFLDRPFIFMIKEHSSKSYLFVGKVEDI